MCQEMMAMNTDGERQLALFAANQVHVRINLEICAERTVHGDTNYGIFFFSCSNFDKCIA